MFGRVGNRSESRSEPSRDGRRRSLLAIVGLLAIGCGTIPASAQVPNFPFFGPMVAPPPSRQVTLFSVLATPGDSTLDPKLKPIAAQMRKVFPGQGFKLLAAETRRVAVNETIVADLGGGFLAGAQLLNPRDPTGKAQLRFELERDEQIDFATIVNTPLNQLFFLEKRLPDGTRIIIGIGVRE